MATVRQCLAQIARHNRSVALRALYSDIAGLGIISMPQITLRDFYKHVSMGTSHLSRWTDPRNPKRPAAVFGKEILAMEKVRLLDEYDGWHFIVDARGEKGPVEIVGTIIDGGELLPLGIYKEGWSAVTGGRKSINITNIIMDKKNWVKLSS